MKQKEKLETIRYILHTKYHQDVWNDFKSDIDVWKWMLIHEPKNEVLGPLMADIKEILTWTDKEIYDFLYREADGLNLKTSSETRAWFEKLYDFFEKNKKVQK